IDTPEVAGTDDQVDLVVNITETTSGSFTFGLGYSQLAGAIYSLGVTQNNFFGTGNRVAINLQENSYSSRVDLSYVDPYFTDNGVSLGYNLSYREMDYGDFNIANYRADNGAFEAIFGIPITETDTVGLSFGIDYNTI